ncbi:MAG: cytochrome c oxidase subunit II [Chloroflexota bacterium]|nr:MAG: cytochrome c oxidase subunit II [Chloroflexota bacterium]
MTARLRRAALLVTAVGVFILFSACDQPGPQWFWERPETDFARTIQGLFSQIVYIAVLVFIVVEGALLWAVLRFRRGANTKMPPQFHGSTNMEIAWTIAPAVILAFIAVPTVRGVFESYPQTTAGAIQVRAIGHQWWWEFQYPDLGITTANEIVFPAGQRLHIKIESVDVIHGFWIPKFGGKRDAIPTRVNELAWTAENPGIYYGQCSQLCGTSHANMRLRAVVKDAAGWDAWVKSMKDANGTPAATAPEDVKKGYQLVSTGACVGCHTIQGTGLKARVGPDLTRFGERTTLGSGIYPNDDAHLVRWLKDPLGSKAGNKMPNLQLTDEDAAAIAAYLRSLK